jgi:IS30 family transposase
MDALLPFEDYVHTITADNGKDYVEHEIVAQALEDDFYVAISYHSWESGVNENCNRLLR